MNARATMAGTTIRIREETRAGLRELEQLTGAGPQELVARAVEAYRREVIMTQTNEAYAQLRAEGSDFFDELREWEVMLMDGLDEEDFTGVGPDDIGLDGKLGNGEPAGEG
jgi:hypothetical protein